jgi:hypothetical protein
MSLTSIERELYEEIWENEGYGRFSPGEEYLSVFKSLAIPESTVLDAGTGSGKGALALQNVGFIVTACDITNAGLILEARTIPFVTVSLWEDLYSVVGSHSYVYCCDVLEHVPTQLTGLVLQRLLDVAELGVFLSISLVPDNFGITVGKPLHQTVQSFVWWRDLLRELGEVTDARDLGAVGLYFVRKREC